MSGRLPQGFQASSCRSVLVALQIDRVDCLRAVYSFISASQTARGAPKAHKYFRRQADYATGEGNRFPRFFRVAIDKAIKQMYNRCIGGDLI